jgi:GNAT superfamily N-acetyltransferase
MPADLRRIAHDSLSLTEAAYLKHYRRGRFRRWNGVALTGSELPGPGFNFAACLDPTPPLDGILPVAADFFADADEGWGVLVEGDAGHPIEAELKARGWAVAEDEPAFVMADITAGTSPAARLPEGVTIRPARTDADRLTLRAVLAGAFGTTAEFAEMMMPRASFVTDPDMLWLIAERDGEPVAAGGYARSGPTAVVSGLATLEAHRGRGIGAALVRATLAAAAAAGCTSASLRSGPRSVPLYERLGFRYVCQHRTYAAPR